MTETAPDTLCFIPCSKSKAPDRDVDPVAPTLAENRIPATWPSLQAARERMSPCVQHSGQSCPALRRYDGGLYNSAPGFRDDVARHLDSGRLDLYIISAAYGLLHANDPIQRYEAEMKGSVAATWRAGGLVDVIADLVGTSRARRVFGFFAGPSRWSGAHAKYRYFFTEGVNAAIASGTAIDTAGCFYRADGLGTQAITGALGRTLLRGLREGFSDRFQAEHADGERDGGILVGLDIIHPSP